MKRWSACPLGEVLDISKEKVEPAEHPEMLFNYVGLEHIEGHTGKLHPRTEANGTGLKSTKYIFHKGEILYGKLRPYLNKVHVAEREGICSTDILVLKPGAAAVPAFVAYFLRSPVVLAQVEGLTQGANLPRLSPNAFLKLTMPTPPFVEQERIVSILGAAEELRCLREQADRRTADLIPALFHEMFGDPATNPRGWPMCQVAEVGDVQLGRQRAPKYQSGRWTRPYLRVANVFEDRIDIGDVLSMDFDEREFDLFRLKYGDILLNEGQSTELVGRPAMWRDELADCCFQNTLIRFRGDPDKVLPEFILAELLSCYRAGEFSRLSAKTSNVAHLGAGRFSKMVLPIPPLHLQRDFAARVFEIRAMKTHQDGSHRRLNDLFQSLLHRAFRGEL